MPTSPIVEKKENLPATPSTVAPPPTISTPAPITTPPADRVTKPDRSNVIGISQMQDEYLKRGASPESAYQQAKTTYPAIAGAQKVGPTVSAETPEQKAATAAAQAQIKKPDTAFDFMKPAAAPTGAPVQESDIPMGGGKVDTTKLTPEQSAYYNANRTYLDALAAKKGMEQQLGRLGEEAATGAEEKYGKDVQQARDDYMASYENARKTAELQNSAALQQANDSLERIQKNAGYFAGAAGFPQTEQGLKAQRQQVQRASELVGRIQQLNDLQMQGMGTDLAKTMRELNEQLDSNVSRAVQESLANLGVLKEMGKLDSVEAINKARNDLRDTLNNRYNDFVKNTFELSKLAYEKAEKGLDAYNKSREFSSEYTNQKNDGIMYSASGAPLLDALGQPITYNPTKSVRSTIDNGNGTYSILYEDGTYDSIKAGQDTSKNIDVNVTEMLGRTTGYAYNSKGNIITDDSGNPVRYAPETQKGQVVTLKDEFGNERAYIFDGKTLRPATGTESTGGAVTPGTGTGEQYGEGTTDFRSLASKYPNVAAFKNNNPAGITWNANFDNPKPGSTAQRLIDAGIQFQKGTGRPKQEGGNYVMFTSIEDGLAAQRIMMEGTYGNSTVDQMLRSWVGTANAPEYSMSLASTASIDPKSKVSELSKEQLDALQVAKLKRESPGLYGELQNAGLVEGNTINFAQPRTFTETEVSAGQAGTTAQEFLESIRSGQFKIEGVRAPDAAAFVPTPKQKTAIDAYNKSPNSATEKEMRRQGIDTAKYNDYMSAKKAAPRDTYEKILSSKLIAGSSRLSDAERENATAEMKNAIAEGDMDYANEILYGIAVNDKKVGDKIYDNQELKAGLSNLRSLLSEYEQSGGDTNVFTSMAETVARKAGTSTDLQLAKAQNQLGVLVADYIRAISGTAASDTEVARLLGNMPAIKNVSELNTAILDNLEDIANKRSRTALETFLGRYKDQGPKIAPEIYGITEFKGPSGAVYDINKFK